MKAVRTLRSEQGFSLVELMIVVAIIGILATIAIPNFQKFQAKAKQTEAKTALAGIYTGEKSYRAEWDTYTTCTNKAGFAPEGNSLYTSGFAGAATVKGTNDTDTTCVLTVGAVNATATSVTEAAAANTFLAAALADALKLGSGQPNVDEWSMNEVRTLQQVKNGL